MSYRYASLLRPLGSWIFIQDNNYSIESPTDSDINPFRPDWKAYDILVTEKPLSKEQIESYQLIDILEMQERKALYDKFQEMELSVNVSCYERMIKEELSDKIYNGKIKNMHVLNKMLTKYINYVNGGA